MEPRRILRVRVAEVAGGDTGQRGFALILAILALLLLTFMGLTLATTTSTELQISNNYRWSQQALYNAEAGIDAGKALLKSMDWGIVLPAARGTAWTGEATPAGPGDGLATLPPARNDAWGNPSRNFENWACDKRGDGMGFGVVLDDGGADAPYQYKTTVFGQTLNGAFTIWVHRPYYSVNEDGPPVCEGCFKDWVPSDVIVLRSEGVAPFTGIDLTGATASSAQVKQVFQAYHAVQLIEVTLTSAQGLTQSGCEFYAGQAGLGPGGANFNPCGVGEGRGIIQGLPTATGTGADVDKTAQ